MSKNNNSFHDAKRIKNDEFYTRIEDIENELKHYKKYFKGKTILCNCDDPLESNFFVYFRNNFELFELKELITICYKSNNIDLFSQNESEKGIVLTYRGHGNKDILNLKGNGDFNNQECIEILKKCDIIVTNPPFSLFKEFLAQLIEYKKDFIFISPIGNIAYKETFPLIKNNKIWWGVTNPKSFKQPDGSFKNFGNIVWYTNLEHNRRNEELILYKTYNKEEYSKYDNIDIINIDKTLDIPIDYKGEMAVPISFLGKYNPDQFEITGYHNGGNKDFIINGKYKYNRIHIKHKK